MQRVLLSFFLIVILPIGGCDIIGLDDGEEDLPIQTEVTYDGLRYWMTVESGSIGANNAPAIRLLLNVENVSDTTITWVGPGDCMILREFAYREGEWGQTAWRLRERFDTSIGCVTDGIELTLEPGETQEPGWTREFFEEWVLGDSLEAGRYRFGAQEIMVDPGDGHPSQVVQVPLLASEPTQVKKIGRE